MVFSAFSRAELRQAAKIETAQAQASPKASIDSLLSEGRALRRPRSPSSGFARETLRRERSAAVAAAAPVADLAASAHGQVFYEWREPTLAFPSFRPSPSLSHI